MTTFLGIQILGVIFGLFMVYFTFVYFKRKEFSFWVLIFWEVLWLALIFVTLFPHSTNFFLEKLGLIRAMDFFMILGFIVVLGLSFYNYVLMNNLKRKLEQMVRQEALQNLFPSNPLPWEKRKINNKITPKTTGVKYVLRGLYKKKKNH